VLPGVSHAFAAKESVGQALNWITERFRGVAVSLRVSFQNTSLLAAIARMMITMKMTRKRKNRIFEI
jgi:hypothetical protein